jgi:DNA-binding PadR family transcriptional regulator
MDRRLLLLGLLRRQEMYGYQVNEFIEQKMHFCVDLKKSTAYYILDKLAEEGYARVEREQEGNRPTRRVYHITPAGEAYFFELLRDNLKHYTRHYYPSDVGIAYMDQLPTQEVRAYLQEKRALMQAELEVLGGAPGHLGPLRHVLEHNCRMLQAELDWLDDLLAELDRHDQG